jgi:hypothetical protein
MKASRLKIIASLVIFANNIYSQMPETDVWLFKIEKDKQKQLTLKQPINITSRKGYDNQPSFSADDKKIYYVSSDGKQADIYYYDLKKKKIYPVTKSPESEYSPVITPDGNYITSVVVEKDSSQYIHFINLLTGIGEKKLPPDSVGYYTFLNKDTVIYYKLTTPHSLRYLITSTGEDKWLGDSPCRTFRAINRHTLIYGLKDSSSVTFYRYDFLLRKAEKYSESASLNEDVIWSNAFGLVKSDQSRLLRFDDEKKEWIVLFDLSSAGIKKITRFCFDSKNRYLVVVDNT